MSRAIFFDKMKDWNLAYRIVVVALLYEPPFACWSGLKFEKMLTCHWFLRVTWFETCSKCIGPWTEIFGSVPPQTKPSYQPLWPRGSCSPCQGFKLSIGWRRAAKFCAICPLEGHENGMFRQKIIISGHQRAHVSPGRTCTSWSAIFSGKWKPVSLTINQGSLERSPMLRLLSRQLQSCGNTRKSNTCEDMQFSCPFLEIGLHLTRNFFPQNERLDHSLSIGYN